jgi:hypothetical protein
MIAVAVVAVLFWILQTSPSRAFFGGISATVSGWVSSLANAPDERKLKSLQERFLINNMSLKPHQTDYVYEVTSSIASVRRYHSMYCLTDDKNPYLFGNNRMKFCADIAQSDILPKDEKN